MYLGKEEIYKQIRALKKRQKIFENDDLAIFIGEKCLAVMRNIAEQYAEENTLSGNLPKGYIDAFDYEIEHLPNNIRITLTNNAKNSQGEYISSFIENGTGVYSGIGGNENGGENENGWWYPSRKSDKNRTKVHIEDGYPAKYVAFTFGQVPKPILNDSLEYIMDNYDSWIDEYLEMEG